MMSSARLAVGQRLVEVGLEPVALAVDDPPLRAAPTAAARPAPRPASALASVVRRRPSNSSRKRLQRVVALAAAVVDQVERDLALLVGDPRHRQDLRRVHDRGVEAGLDALVQEDRVEHRPGRPG